VPAGGENDDREDASEAEDPVKGEPVKDSK
jgi:hypothetical protein